MLTTRSALLISIACSWAFVPTVSSAQVEPAAILQTAAPALPPTIRATFFCGSGKVLYATFDNRGHGSVALASPDGRRLVLPRARSASGARYADLRETLVFWNKGESAE